MKTWLNLILCFLYAFGMPRNVHGQETDFFLLSGINIIKPIFNGQQAKNGKYNIEYKPDWQIGIGIRRQVSTNLRSRISISLDNHNYCVSEIFPAAGPDITPFKFTMKQRKIVTMSSLNYNFKKRIEILAGLQFSFVTHSTQNKARLRENTEEFKWIIGDVVVGINYMLKEQILIECLFSVPIFEDVVYQYPFLDSDFKYYSVRFNLKYCFCKIYG